MRRAAISRVSYDHANKHRQPSTLGCSKEGANAEATKALQVAAAAATTTSTAIETNQKVEVAFPATPCNYFHEGFGWAFTGPAAPAPSGDSRCMVARVCIFARFFVHADTSHHCEGAAWIEAAPTFFAWAQAAPTQPGMV